MSPVLPFDREGEIKLQGGETVATEVPLAFWPLGDPRETSRGEAYDFTGEAHPSAAEQLVGKSNREIIVDGRRFKVIGAEAFGYFPHVDLKLREMR